MGVGNIKDKQNLVIISGTSNKGLTEEISSYLRISPTPITVKKFKDTETYVRIESSVRGKEVYIIQSTSFPVNDNLMELLIMIDAAKRDSANKIHVVIPYYAYARQDRKAASREPISSKLVADLLSAAGASTILTIDLHSPQIQGFFDIPLTHLTAFYTFANYFKDKNISNIVVVSPDAGSANKTRKLADLLNSKFAILHKKRPKHDEAVITEIIGNVKNKNAIIFDDIIDTGGTLAASIKTIKQKGAKDIYVAATHGVFSPPATEKLKKAPVKEVVVTNTISIPKERAFPQLKVLPLGFIIAEAVKRQYKHESISELFNSMQNKFETDQKITKY